MRGSARHTDAIDSDNDYYAVDDFFPGERICPPVANGGNAMLRGYALIFLVLGGGWAVLTKQADLQGWMSTATAAVSSFMPPPGPDSIAVPSQTEASTAKPAPPPAIPQPIDTKEVADAPGDAAAKPDAPETDTATLPAPDEAVPAPLPPPNVDRSNPYQVRAAAVGLHPELSQVLLKRLSPTDYRNAGIAIRTAMAETPDDGVFVWPRQRTPQLALFKVHFVKGAAADCRRYVVTVTKDGWTTTALPMEKCGQGIAGRHVKRAVAG